MSRYTSTLGNVFSLKYLHSFQHNFPRNHSLCLFSSSSAQNELLQKECCKLLGLKPNYTAVQLRDTFLQLAKRYHPDSGSDQADDTKFADIQSAYRFLRSLDKSANSVFDDADQILEHDFGIKHTVPQHRQYLTFGGVGIGSPSQREKTYQLSKVDQAYNNVFEHRVKKAKITSGKQVIKADAALARQHKSRQGMDRLVEDLIQASMARGEFDNLPGSGKPLRSHPENPYVDTTTHKLNQILISNGFTPEWIVLQKEIKEDRVFFRAVLQKRRAELGRFPLNEHKVIEWVHTLADLKQEVKRLNLRIDKFNMIVPTLNKQQIHFNLEAEARKLMVMEDPQVESDEGKCGENYTREQNNC